jgi:hypothetical protein
MILIGNILVDNEITKLKFFCNTDKCKGACCTFPGEVGAPLLDSEIEQIKNAIEPAFEFLSERAKSVIRAEGAIQGSPGNYSTNCIDKKDCVFVYYEGDVAKCSIEKAYLSGKTKFRKPISCHLFPIRVSNFSGTYLYFSKYEECEPAFKYGEEENIHLVEMLKDALVRAYGNEWYEYLWNYIMHKKNGLKISKVKK